MTVEQIFCWGSNIEGIREGSKMLMAVVTMLCLKRSGKLHNSEKGSDVSGNKHERID